MREPPQQQPTALQEEETTHPPEDGVGPAIDQPANERLRLQGADGDDVHAADDDRQAAGAPLPLQLNRHLGRAG